MASEPLCGDWLPAGVRPSARDLLRIVASVGSLAELVARAGAAGVDLCDLLPAEVALLEGISVRTLQGWRTAGTGPDYRNAGGVRYPVRDYLAWRLRGRQRMTSQGKRRGPRRD